MVVVTEVCVAHIRQQVGRLGVLAVVGLLPSNLALFIGSGMI